MKALAFKDERSSNTSFKPFPVDLLDNNQLKRVEIEYTCFILSKTDNNAYVSSEDLFVNDNFARPWLQRTQQRKHTKAFIEMGVLEPIIKNKKTIGYLVNVKHPIFNSKTITHVPKDLLGNNPKSNYHAILRYYHSKLSERTRTKHKNDDRPLQKTLAKKHKLDIRTFRKRDKNMEADEKLKKIPYDKYKKNGHTYDIQSHPRNKTFSKTTYSSYFANDGFCPPSYKLNKFSYNYTESRVVAIKKRDARQERLWLNISKSNQFNEDTIQKVKQECENRNLVFFNEKALQNYVAKVYPRFKQSSKIYLRDLTNDIGYLKELESAKDNLDCFNPAYIQYCLRNLKYFNRKSFATIEDAVMWGKDIFKNDRRQPETTFSDKYQLEVEYKPEDIDNLVVGDWINDPAIVDEIIKKTWGEDIPSNPSSIVSNSIKFELSKRKNFKYSTRQTVINYLSLRLKEQYPSNKEIEETKASVKTHEDRNIKDIIANIHSSTPTNNSISPQPKADQPANKNIIEIELLTAIASELLSVCLI